MGIGHGIGHGIMRAVESLHVINRDKIQSF